MRGARRAREALAAMAERRCRIMGEIRMARPFSDLWYPGLVVDMTWVFLEAGLHPSPVTEEKI